ncbi:electron transfer flavoprotein subunit beta/FixA family protein [Natronobacterium gregoryi]|uniref:Electron transfer flavoprotein alpha/beta-subunit n=2 Tax=Natronobacterium gregoryi TaxID=44930 RepID=L0AJ47_NATGS|nr:electron transfer flavoprotein subunit beta/FixA family protein [Natronobacterium gregoryi]AFZ73177.1 electron transfer flavoprotein, beta subunit [Natronobacterium gregoryi SP2]ELY71366.1 Electron transfer flavoprotein alpha/beta-subunit [Natronobacterium gregoryi SP2]PLK21587.1 electron transfer flavoprotein subunit beta/FixA family protein [Natronobacterium gregoryi SP2]SFI59420.1 electron transfer flavoprotein beta subunit [Natronobacterium gregoryi]
MKILVTVKEVATVDDEFEIEGTEIADQYLGVDLNEWDDYAVEEAVQLQEAGIADEVVTVTIGPEDCEQTIRQALAKGADRAVRVWDDALEDVDLLDVEAKTDILTAVVEEEDPDLVLSGVQAGDDAFGATGVSVAEKLGYEWAAVVNHLEHDLEGGVASVRRELEGGVEELTDVELPAVLTIQTGINEPRYASLRGIRQAQRKPLDVQTLADIDVDETVVDSDLELTDMYEPESESDVTVWEGSAEETAGELADLLEEKGVAP